MPSKFGAATFVSEIEPPFKMGFLFSLVILWDRYYGDSSCGKGFWCLRAHGLLDVPHRVEQSGPGCALAGCWKIPRAAGLQTYRARNHLQKSSRPTSVHIFTAVLQTGSWNPAARGILQVRNTLDFWVQPSTELIYKSSSLNKTPASLILLFCIRKIRLEILF